MPCENQAWRHVGLAVNTSTSDCTSLQACAPATAASESLPATGHMRAARRLARPPQLPAPHPAMPRLPPHPCARFCYQCEQTARGTGCTTVGVCGKTPETTYLQVCGSWGAGLFFRRKTTCAVLPRTGLPAEPALPALLRSLCVPGRQAFDFALIHCTPSTAHLPQDLLTYSCKGLGCWAHFAAQQGEAQHGRRWSPLAVPVPCLPFCHECGRIQQSACMLPRHAPASLLTHLPLPPPCCVSLSRRGGAH